MVSDELKKKAEQARNDGYIVLNLEDDVMRLSSLLEFVQSIFPNHSLHQLAITEAEENELVVAAELSIGTKAN